VSWRLSVVEKGRQRHFITLQPLRYKFAVILILCFFSTKGYELVMIPNSSGTRLVPYFPRFGRDDVLRQNLLCGSDGMVV